MAFFQDILKALGFGNNDDVYMEESGEDVTVIPRKTLGGGIAGELTPESQESVVTDNSADDKAEITSEFLSAVSPDEIFTEVLAVFNEALPGFVRDSINPEAQRKLLYDKLSDSLKQYIGRINTETEILISRRWERERVALGKKLEELNSRIERAEEGEQNSRKSQLSAERQKRAMSERVHDLEAQIATLQAENEQFELENKSLLNKLKVSEVHEQDSEALREQVKTLTEQIRNGNPPALSQAEVEEIEILRSKAERTEALEKQVQELSADMDTARAKIEMGSKMLASQQNIAVTARQEAADKAKELEAAATEIQRLGGENARLIAELEEANVKIDRIHDIEKQVLRFDEIKQRKESRISELQEQKQELSEMLRSKDNEIASLRKTVDRNLAVQAHTEHELKETIASLQEEIEERKAISGNMPDVVAEPFVPLEKSEKKPRRRKQQRVRISAIDESLDSTDWLVATPQKDKLAALSQSDSETFGYVQPPRKQFPDNDAQMLLFE